MQHLKGMLRNSSFFKGKELSFHKEVEVDNRLEFDRVHGEGLESDGSFGGRHCHRMMQQVFTKST